jgi:hypothetical protein
MEELVDFEWTRSIDAYVIRPPRSHVRMWRRKGAQVGTVPTPTSAGASDATLSTAGKRYFEMYRPTEFPELFQIFADKPATAEGMRDFYNKFGPLQWGSGRVDGVAPAPKPGWCEHSVGVRGALSHHATLRRAIELFEAGDLSALSQGVNQARLGHLRIELRPRADSRVAIAWMPSNLIQFLWLQLALFAAGDAKLFRCEQCGHPFLVGSKTGRRSKAKYCSNTCRLAAFRERRDGMIADAHAGHTRAESDGR